jgi:hypothetical protein
MANVEVNYLPDKDPTLKRMIEQLNEQPPAVMQMRNGVEFRGVFVDFTLPYTCSLETSERLMEIVKDYEHSLEEVVPFMIDRLGMPNTPASLEDHARVAICWILMWLDQILHCTDEKFSQYLDDQPKYYRGVDTLGESYTPEYSVYFALALSVSTSMKASADAEVQLMKLTSDGGYQMVDHIHYATQPK